MSNWQKQQEIIDKVDQVVKTEGASALKNYNSRMEPKRSRFATGIDFKNLKK